MKHRHRWKPWQRVMTMLYGLMWWRYCRDGTCLAVQHRKVKPSS